MKTCLLLTLFSLNIVVIRRYRSRKHGTLDTRHQRTEHLCESS